MHIVDEDTIHVSFGAETEKVRLVAVDMTERKSENSL